MAARGFEMAWRISQHAGFTVVRGDQCVCAEPYIFAEASATRSCRAAWILIRQKKKARIAASLRYW